MSEDVDREREILRRWAKETIGKLSLDLDQTYQAFDERMIWMPLYDIREAVKRLEEVCQALIDAAGDEPIPDELLKP